MTQDEIPFEYKHLYKLSEETKYAYEKLGKKFYLRKKFYLVGASPIVLTRRRCTSAFNRDSGCHPNSTRGTKTRY